MGSEDIGEELNRLSRRRTRRRTSNDDDDGDQSGDYDNEGWIIDLYSQLWHACAGPSVYVPRTGDKVYYFPQGHIDQVTTYMNQDGCTKMPIYKIPSKILCKVVNIGLKAEANTDEVFAQITLLPLDEDTIFSGATSSSQNQRSSAKTFIKKLSPSDTSVHGGFSLPKKNAEEFFPPLDMSQEIPNQELVAKDLHGKEWKFRHIYRGQPKRHLLTGGWSKFITEKNVKQGDSSVFIRGQSGELYVGIRRATRPQYRAAATVLSSLSVQHGILATAYQAVSTGSMFSVYYRPWSDSADFIIPYAQYMKSAQLEFAIGTRFRMQYRIEQRFENKSMFVGVIVGMEDVDCVRWPDSDWRRLKVEWDFRTGVHSIPKRVSHWCIEPIGITKKKRIKVSNSYTKRKHVSDSSTVEIPFVINKDILETRAGYTHQTGSGVLQGQEIRAVGASEQGTSAQPTRSGNKNLQPLKLGDLLSLAPGSSVLLLGDSNSDIELDNLYLAKLTSKENSIGAAPFPNVDFTCHTSQNGSAGDEKKVEHTQRNGKSKCMLFGTNLSETPSKPLPLHNVVFIKHNSLSSVPPAISESRSSEAIHVLDPSKGNLCILPVNQPKNCCSSANRTCTKVQKFGTALGRSVDLERFCGYKELVSEVDKLFELNGALAGRENGWNCVYINHEGYMLVLGDCIWAEFRSRVQKIIVYPKEVVEMVNLERTN